VPDNDKYDKFAIAFLNSTIGDDSVTGAFVFNGDPIYDNLEWITKDYKKPTKEEFEAGVDALVSAEPMTFLRQVRDGMLKATDYWAFEDTPTMTDEQKKYRQDLRDITKSATSLDDVKWPTKPE
tara:strand:+ start:4349 stop:4720 length:372 start_codon:yes stop_codon:yes gene_type:complete